MTRIRLGGAFAVSAALLATPAAAHVTLATTQATPNSGYRGVAQVNHGCGGTATTSVRVTIPEGVIAARPMPKAGWTIELEKGDYARTYSLWGEKLSSGVKSITWKGGKLPDDFYDEFVFAARLTDAFKPGETIYFPVLQTCETGSSDWAQTPASGQGASQLKWPAPSVRVVEVAAAGSAAVDTMVKAGDLTIRAPWSRATPAGAKVAGGYLAVTNGGSQPDRLTGGTFEGSSEVQIHEMKTEDGVMHMRPVDGGVVIPPGGTVELKPGGYHLMLMGLTRQFKQGDVVKGTLTFEKAGTVPVTLTVGGIGAQQMPGGADDMAGHKH